jgi:hypothetical protein
MDRAAARAAVDVDQRTNATDEAVESTTPSAVRPASSSVRGRDSAR